jgi:ribonuclease T1
VPRALSLLAGVLLLVAGCVGPGGPTATATLPLTGAASPTATADLPMTRGPSAAPSTVTDPAPTVGGVDPVSGLPWVDPGDLPPEARDTLALIASDGPFPFDRDGLVFGNRERLLPDRGRGHYREYTVITPGEDDRGARRIVAGADGERYYTDDHYESFRRIRP